MGYKIIVCLFYATPHRSPDQIQEILLQMCYVYVESIILYLNVRKIFFLKQNLIYVNNIKRRSIEKYTISFPV